ncbi:MAG TPA: hypothetical protein VF905_08910 [Nitrospirota bacterium]
MKSSKPKSPPKKDSNLGDMYFVYDQYNKHAIVDGHEGYIRPISGRVELFTGDDRDNAQETERERGTVAGRFDASYINVDKSLADGVKLYDVLDAYSSETAEIYETLFDPHTYELRENVKKLLGEVTFRNMLVINSVEILPPYRGMGLGLATMWDLIRRHSAGCGIAALKAFPIQFRAGRLGDLEESEWNKKMGYDPYRYAVEFAHEKLIFHLKKLGFEPIGDAGVMAHSTPWQNPIPKEIHCWVPGSVLPKQE